MGDEISSFDWLPAGWKVESRVRRNGKKDRCYTDPSNEHKFYSKPEVLRYLKSAGTKVEEPTKKGSKNRSGIKLVVKDAVADGLPAGWIKEIRVTKKGHKTRRDSYYTEPVTGNLFRSMKEVSRYLDTRKIAKDLSEPQEHEATKSSVKTGKETSANNKEQKLDTDNTNHKAAAEEAPATDHVNESNANDLEQKEIKETSPVVEDLEEKVQPGKSLEMHETESNGKRKLKKKRGSELPSRASKRLAGVQIELPMEQKMHKQVHQAAATDTAEEEAKRADNCRDSKDSGEHVKKARTEDDADKKQENLHVSSPGDVASHEEQAKQGVVESKVDEKQETPMDLSLNDLWKDPCIEFAIKTLTGAIPIVDENKVTKEPAISVDLPLGDIWSDPCIEFAVKTLTSDVPIGNNIGVENVFQQPHYSPNFGAEKGLFLPNFWPNEKGTACVSKDFQKQL